MMPAETLGVAQPAGIRKCAEKWCRKMATGSGELCLGHFLQQAIRERDAAKPAVDGVENERREE